jgi:xanthine dehydrogenase accessory factor
MNDRQIVTALLAALEERRAVALVTATAGEGLFAPALGQRLLVWADGSTSQGDLHPGELEPQVLADALAALAARTPRRAEYRTAAGVLGVFIDVQAPPPHLIIVGAGHIAAPLAEIGRICDFEVTVIDDRPQYANRLRFPTADRVIAGEFRRELRRLRGSRPTFDAHTFLVLVTRGHQHDVACLLEVLDDPLAYIGMIGSRRRIEAVYELLAREQGIPPEKFDRIHAPVGLDIGAQTPAEIAVCIMAEIISVQRMPGGASVGGSLSTPLQQQRIARRTRRGNRRG